MKAKLDQNKQDKVGLPASADPSEDSIIAGASPEDLRAAKAAIA
jgi:hypothetical protein